MRDLKFFYSLQLACELVKSVKDCLGEVGNLSGELKSLQFYA